MVGVEAIADQLCKDLVALAVATPPSGLPVVTDQGVNFFFFRHGGGMTEPAVVIGWEDAPREKAKGMTGTSQVALRIGIRSDADLFSETNHRAVSRAVQAWINGMAVKPGPLALTYVHAFLPDEPESMWDERVQITILKWVAVITGMVEV